MTRRAFLVGLGLGAVCTGLAGRPARADDPEAPPPQEEPPEPLPDYQSNFAPQATLQTSLSSLPPVSTLKVRAKISTTYFTSLDHAEAQVTADGAFNIVNQATGANVVSSAPAGEVYAITNNSNYLKVRRVSDGWTLGQYTGPILIQPLDHARLVQVKNVTRGSYGNPRLRGYLELKQSSSGLVNIVNVLDSAWLVDPMEKYLYGVVPIEMPVDYGAEALKAQAVAARTFAASRYNGSYVDVDDSTNTQAYYGFAAEKMEGNQAVDATRGVVATYNGSVISTLFSACCGGHTEHNENVYTRGSPVAYLRGVRCYCDGSYADLSSEAAATAFWQGNPSSHCDWSSGLYRWPQINWSRSDLQAIVDRYLPDVPPDYRSQSYSAGSLGELYELQAVERGVAGKIRRLRIRNRAGNYWDVMSDYWIRYVLRSTIGSGIQFSSNMVFFHARNGDGSLASVAANGGGWGHGVGMCQRGAKGMADLSYSYSEILSHYYTGMALEGGAVPPSTPRQLAPHNGTLVLNTTDVTLTWTGDATEYEGDVINANTGQLVIKRLWQPGTSWFLGQLPVGSYQWRLRGRNATGVSSYSPWWLLVSAERIFASYLPLTVKDY